MLFKWFDLVVLFGILQGLVSGLILITKPKKRSLTSKLLAAILFVFSLLSFKIAIHTLGLWEKPIFTYFPLAIDLLIQPLLYCYIASLTIPDFKLSGVKWLHFAPVVLFLLHAVAVYIAVLPVNSLPEKNAIAERWHYNLIKSIEDDLSVISVIFYGFLGFRLVTRYREWLYQNISDTRYPAFTWLKNVLLATGVLGLGLLTNVVLDQVFDFNALHFFHWEIFYIYLSALIYYISYRSFRENEPGFLSGPHIPDFQKAAKYNYNELQNAKEAVMIALISNSLFLNGELTLNMLAAHLQLSPVLVSESINKQLGKSFRNLVNELRVEEFKKKANNTEMKHLSIFGVALECGFNSEASFYRVFRHATGMSPKNYLTQSRQ